MLVPGIGLWSLLGRVLPWCRGLYRHLDVLGCRMLPIRRRGLLLRWRCFRLLLLLRGLMRMLRRRHSGIFWPCLLGILRHGLLEIRIG